MPEDNSNPYDDAPGAAPEKEAGAGGKTALLPKALFAGKELKPGDKCDVTIVADHGDEVEVSGCGSESSEKSKAAPEPAPGPSGDGGMRSMLED